ncbi:PREDICTED: ribosomal L1 domain-containing protein 1-like [Nicrophorus vespilloides]|uniref:Ribosomal L1 domain-containing protein 1-like n=1 Tax=Nicrophorus vespilloides TaxID=110193 RepID=A0ABM1N7D2_NICVS|nr:PREDICTED: ribosomal L1 domain-containing protein 1-like [Nicrophorus vespilloides]
MAKVKKNLEKSAKPNVIKTAEKKNSPKNRVKSVIKKAKQEKTVDVDKAKKIVKNLVKAKDLQNQLEKAPKNIQEIVQEKTKKKKNKNKVKSPEKKKPAEVTVDSPTKVVEQNTNSIALDSKTVESAVNSLFHLLENDDKVKLFDDQEERFLLQIKCIKVPEANPMIKRITLKHGKLNANSDICFIVKDYKKPKDVDKTIEFYEKIFEMHNITNIKCIMPFYTASTEYAEYENQRRLVDLYDSFLVDASISNQFSTMFRAVFIKKGKMPRMVRMRASNLKDQVEKSLKMVPLKICDGRDSYLIEFGHHLMKKQEIIENLHHVVRELNIVFPGGHDNIRNMYVKTPTGVSIPLYLSLANSSDVVTPVVKRKLPKACKDVRGELSTFTDAEVIVKPHGEVILVRNKKEQSLGDDEDCEEEEDVEDEAPNKIRKVDVDAALPVEKKKKGKGKNKRQLQTGADEEIIEPKGKQAKKSNEGVKSNEVTPEMPKGKVVQKPSVETAEIVKEDITEKPKGKGKKNKKSNEETTQKANEEITEKPKGKGNKNMKPTVETKSEVITEKPKGKGNKKFKPNAETVQTKNEVITEKTNGKGKNNNLKPNVETKSEVVAEKTKGKGKNNVKPIEVVAEAKHEEIVEKTKGKGKKNTKPIEVVVETKSEEIVEKTKGKGKKNAKLIEEPVEVKSDVTTEKPKGKGKKNKRANEEVTKVEIIEKVAEKMGKGKKIKATEETLMSPKAQIVQKAKKLKVESEAVSNVATNVPKKIKKGKQIENKPVEAVPAVANNKNAGKKGKNSEKDATVLTKSGSEKVKPANGAQKKMNSPAGKNKKKKNVV